MGEDCDTIKACKEFLICLFIMEGNLLEAGNIKSCQICQTVQNVIQHIHTKMEAFLYARSALTNGL